MHMLVDKHQFVVSVLVFRTWWWKIYSKLRSLWCITWYIHIDWCSPRCSSLPSSSGLLTCFSVEVYGMCTGLQRQTICCRFTSSNTDQHLGWITCATLKIVVVAAFDCIPSCPQMKIITTSANVMQMKHVPHHCVSHKLCPLLHIRPRSL